MTCEGGVRNKTVSHTPQPVSYTHLDVYKRQSPLLRSNRGETVANSVVQSWFGSAAFEMIRDHEIIKAINEGGDLGPGVGYLCIATHFDTVIQPPETCFLQPDSPEAVSYTHLDVYKRQVLMSSAFFGSSGSTDQPAEASQPKWVSRT